MAKIVRRQGRFLAFSLLLLLFLLSACGALPGTTASSPTPKPKDPTKLLNDTQRAMLALKSEHQVIAMTADGQALSGLTGSQASSSVDMSQSSLNMKIESDVQKPNQSIATLYMDMSVSTMDINYNLKEINKDNQTYIQNLKKGVWYVLDQQTANTSTNPFSSFNSSTNFDGMATSFLKGKLTDHGTETVNGVRLRHLTSTLDQSTASTALGSSAQLSNIDTATIDIWIDEVTSYTHRIDLKATFTPNSTTQSSPTNSATNPLEVSLDFSNFNKSVTITTPTGAIPVNSIGEILS